MKRSASGTVKSASSSSSSVDAAPASPGKRPYFGEEQCGKCSLFTAYYWMRGRAVCGRCSRNQQRIGLKKNPDAAKVRAEKYAAHVVSVEAARTPGAGTVRVAKMQMMKNPEQTPGRLLVFPNFKHGPRTDGLGMPALSPKSLGPVEHGQPGLPVARTIEGFHQGAKFWSWDLYIDTGLPTDEAVALRHLMHTEEEPRRHKHDPALVRKYGNVNRPMFSLYFKKNGDPVRYSYMQCRYFYCYWYERLAPQTREFKELKQRIQDGYHLTLMGYDGYNVTTSLWECYNNIDVPFGHELVLFTLLTESDPENYPWRRYYREHSDIYKDVIDYPDW